MALTKEQEDKFDEVLHEAMRKQFYRGMSIGAQSVCKVVLDLLNDSAMPFMKRIETIKKYCSKSLKNNKLIFGDDQEEQTEESTKEQGEEQPAQEEKSKKE